MINISILGLSHQGLVFAAFFAKLNLKVICFDNKINRIKKLKKDNITDEVEFEPNLKKQLSNKNLFFTSDITKIKKSNTILICEDVLIKSDGSKNDKQIINLINILNKINFNHVVNIILFSQINPGFSRFYSKKLINNKKVNFFYSPDILTIGEALKVLNEKKIFFVGGAKKKININSKKILDDFFKIIKKRYIFSTYESVELTKEAIQLKLAMDVTFVNIISDYIDLNDDYEIEKIIEYMKLDKRFSKYGYWRPGLGFGGGHIERGLKMFESNKNKFQNRIIKATINYNESRIFFASKIIKSNNIKNIGIWGLSYKKNTNSTFRSYSRRLIELLKNKYSYFCFDESCRFENTFNKKYNIVYSEDKREILKKTDCLLILSDWDQFKMLDKSYFDILAKKVFFDPYMFYSKHKDYFQSLKIKYYNL